MIESRAAGRRLKVLMVPARYPSPAEPFLATPLREHARAVALTNDVMVLDAPREALSPAGLFFTERDRDDGIPVLRSRFRRSPIARTTYLVFVASMVAAARRILREGFRPDVVHAHMYFVALPAVVLAKWLRVPVVITEHSECYAAPLPWRVRQEARLAFRLADAVVPVSESLRALMEAQGVRAAFRVIPNPVDTAVFRPAAEPREPGRSHTRILFVGRLMPVKGVDILLAGLARLLKARRDFSADLIGDGAYRPAYESMASRLGLDRIVTFRGFQPRAVVAESMRRADLLVMPSRSENSPTVLVEALASGLPVVTADVGGVRELVPKDMGVFFSKEDPPALAEALGDAMDARDTYDPWALACYARDHFGLGTIGQRIDAVYRDVLAKRA